MFLRRWFYLISMWSRLKHFPNEINNLLYLWFWESIWLCVWELVFMLVWAKVLNLPVHLAVNGAQEDHCGEGA
jgi:hypothetical protein